MKVLKMASLIIALMFACASSASGAGKAKQTEEYVLAGESLVNFAKSFRPVDPKLRDKLKPNKITAIFARVRFEDGTPVEIELLYATQQRTKLDPIRPEPFRPADADFKKILDLLAR